MNWGWKIAVAYSLFVVGMIALVIAANRQTNDLVTEDYYASGTAYQEVIDAKANAAALADAPRFAVSEGHADLSVRFPMAAGSPEGEWRFYRPSDASLDFRVAVEPDADGLQRVPLQGLQSGFWRVTLAWSANGTAYHQETTLNLP